MIDFSAIKKAQTLEGKIDIFTCKNSGRTADYIQVIEEGKASECLSIDEFNSRIKKLLMKLDGEWFCNDNKKRFDEIMANLIPQI